jgi:hypothetical protein
VQAVRKRLSPVEQAMYLKALYKLSYGVHVVTPKKHNLIKGQFANTIFQVTSEPHSWYTIAPNWSSSQSHLCCLPNKRQALKNRFASIVGSYDWCSQAKEQISNMIPSLKEEPLKPMIVKGSPEEEGLKALDVLASTIARKTSYYETAAWY